MFKVTDVLYRGKRPLNIKDLFGFQQIIVLQSGDEDRYTDSLYEAQLRTKRSDPTIYPNIQVHYIKCSNIFPPSQGQVSQFLDLCSYGKRTFVHCHSGVDRTGFMIAVYRMTVLNWTFEDAYDEWVILGRHWWFDWWKKSLKECGEYL